MSWWPFGRKEKPAPAAEAPERAIIGMARRLAFSEFSPRRTTLVILNGMNGVSVTIMDLDDGTWLAELREGAHNIVRVRHEVYRGR